MNVSLKYALRHMGKSAKNVSLRSAFGIGSSRAKIRAKPFQFSILGQNMALLGADVIAGIPEWFMDYKGTDREGAIRAIIEQIRQSSPDVVGLCEVFKNSEREQIRNALSNQYPYSLEGPDEDDLTDEDGGLILLSRHPILSSKGIIFRDCAGDDCMANKGVLAAQIWYEALQMPMDLFFTHMQDIEAPFTVTQPVAGGPTNVFSTAEEALYAQLSTLRSLIGNFGPVIADDGVDIRAPKVIFGDINIPAEVDKHYNKLMNTLNPIVDLWTVAGNPVASGFTNVVDNNFYEDSDDKPTKNKRLDYILMRAGNTVIPILSSIDVERFRHNGRHISDHFGVRARFGSVVQIERSI